MDNTLSVGLLLISNSISDGAEKAMVSRWLQEYNTFTDRNRKSKQVIAAIADGYDTISEIGFITGYNVTTLRRILSRLVNQKKIRHTRIKNNNSKYEHKYELV